MAFYKNMFLDQLTFLQVANSDHFYDNMNSLFNNTNGRIEHDICKSVTNLCCACTNHFPLPNKTFIVNLFYIGIVVGPPFYFKLLT